MITNAQHFFHPILKQVWVTAIKKLYGGCPLIRMYLRING